MISGAFYIGKPDGFRYMRAVAFRHFMQSFTFFIVPLINMCLTRRLGKKIRGFTLCEWLTVRPVMGFFPHISHTFAMNFLQ